MENHPNNPKTIHDIAQSGDIVEFQKLLQDNPSLLNERNVIMSETPLHISASKNMLEIIKFLLEWKGTDKVDLESNNMYEETPLHLAAKNGSNEAARLLLVHGASVDSKTMRGMTALHLSILYSIQSKDCSIVKTLLENNADSNAIDDNEEAPLHLAAKNGGNEVARILLTHGAIVDSKIKYGMTALHLSVLYSIQSKDCSVLTTLLEHKADSNATDDNEETPLHLAAKNGCNEVARLLLAGGAIVDSENLNGETPLHLAARSGCNDIAKLLLAHGAFVDSKTKNRYEATALHFSVLYSVQSKDCSIVKTLLEHKADSNATDYNGETPLHLAARSGCNDIATLLLAHGAFVDSQNKCGFTPLHLYLKQSIGAEEFSIVETLVEYNANWSVTDDEGMTPLDHLSKLPESGKLCELLLSLQEEQRKRKALEAGSKKKENMDALEKELSNIVGLDELKLQLRKWAKGMLMDERRRLLGVKFGTGRLPHMAFLGNPGTGKTMVARILGKLLHSVGILRTATVIQVQRTDLIAEYVGQTGTKTRKKIEEANGGILFVDEAYQLIPDNRCGGDYGLEALEEIMSIMDSGEVLVIFAGYNEPMERVISSNEGFCRRVTNILRFKDLNCRELANVLHIKINNEAEGNLLYGFKLHSSCSIDAIAELIERETTEIQRMMMNGGLVDIMLNNAKGNLDHRLSDDCVEIDELMTITLEDFEASIRLLPQ